MSSTIPGREAPAGAAPPILYVTTRRHLRGSSLLLAGRAVSILANFATQVLAVRYLSKGDYGAFAYALAVASMGAHVTLLGLNRGVNRFVPIDQERGHYGSMFGTIGLALGAVVGLGLALFVLAMGLRGFLYDPVAGHGDPLAVTLVLILIWTAPLQALDTLFQGLLAIFAGARSIFIRRHVLGPGLKLGAVL